MPASRSREALSLRTRPLLAAAAAVVLLAGCASGSDDVSTEPAVSLEPAASAAPTPEGAPASPDSTSTPTTGTTAMPDDDLDDDSPDDDVVPMGTLTVVDNSAEVDVEDQTGDGRSAQVEEVRIGAEPGFVVIYDPGQSVLGWTYVPSGVRGVTVELTTPVQASRELVAALFRDDGDKEFDPQVDPLIVEQDDDDNETEPVTEDFDYILR